MYNRALADLVVVNESKESPPLPLGILRPTIVCMQAYGIRIPRSLKGTVGRGLIGHDRARDQFVVAPQRACPVCDGDREVITLQLGGFANFVGAHYWNFQVQAVSAGGPVLERV